MSKLRCVIAFMGMILKPEISAPTLFSSSQSTPDAAHILLNLFQAFKTRSKDAIGPDFTPKAG